MATKPQEGKTPLRLLLPCGKWPKAQLASSQIRLRRQLECSWGFPSLVSSFDYLIPLHCVLLWPSLQCLCRTRLWFWHLSGGHVRSGLQTRFLLSNNKSFALFRGSRFQGSRHALRMHAKTMGQLMDGTIGKDTVTLALTLF